MIGKIRAWNNRNDYIQDMSFLATIVWPMIHNDQLGHDSFYCERYPNSRGYPTRRYHLEHCGGVYDEFDVPRIGDMNLLAGRQSPPACRRKPDWILG
jgi:hypothetical protein